MLILYAGLLALTVFGFVKVPAGFIPSQDQGYFIVVTQLPEGASLSRTDKVVRKITDLAREVEGVTGVVAFAGFDAATGTNAPNKAGVFTPLAPFEERVKRGLPGQKILGGPSRKNGDDRRSLGPCLSTPTRPRHGQRRRLSHDG